MLKTIADTIKKTTEAVVDVIHPKAENKADLERIALLIGNIEQIFHQNFLTEINSYEFIITKRCKTELAQLLINNQIEDVVLVEDRINTVQKKDTHLPTIHLHFYPTDLDDAVDEEHKKKIIKRNALIQSKVDLINSLKSKNPASILALKQEYLKDTDGFIFRLNFDSLIDFDGVKSKFDYLMDILENLSIEAAMIMLDDLEWISIDKVNPYSEFTVNNQEVAFTFIDLKNYLPSRSLLYFLKTLLSDIENSVFSLNKDQLKIIDFEKSYNEENGSFAKINLRIQ